MAKVTKSSDGLKKIGPGKWEARITARDPNTSEKVVDTTRIIEANSKLDALTKRKVLRDELVGSDDEWSVEQAIEVWLPTQRSGSRSVRATHTRRFKECFGKRKLSAVSSLEIQRWLVDLECGDDTANMHRATLLALYKFAVSKGRLQGANTAARTVKRHTPKSNEDFVREVDEEEVSSALLGEDLSSFFRTLDAHSPNVYPLMKCQLLLGCRVSEVIALRWKDINWNTGAVTIRLNCAKNGDIGPTKNKKPRVAALGPEGLAFMRGHKAQMAREAWPGHEVWAFPRPILSERRTRDTWVYETIRLAVRSAQALSGVVVGKATHAMRHTHVTLARALQVDAMLQAAVGHADARLTDRYTANAARAAAAVGYASDFEAQLIGEPGGPGGVSGGGSVKSIAKSLKIHR